MVAPRLWHVCHVPLSCAASETKIQGLISTTASALHRKRLRFPGDGLMRSSTAKCGVLGISRSPRGIQAQQTERRLWQTLALAAYNSGRTASQLRISFALPYRCQFGQNLSIVGSPEALGSWNVYRSVGMHWSDGDVWTAEVDMSHSGLQDDVEYKYIVRDHDGRVALWTPGLNYQLQLAQFKGRASASLEKVRILDAWDRSCRQVEVELGQENSSATSAAGTQVDLTRRLTQEAEKALQELKKTVEQSSARLEGVSPSSLEALEADRAVASAARKAADLAKALNEYKAKGRLANASQR